MKTVDPGFCFWSSLQGLGLIFCDFLPALSLSMHQGSCKPFTKPGLKYSTWIDHEILLVRHYVVELHNVMKLTGLHNLFCLSGVISFVNSRDNYFHIAVISGFPTPWRWVVWDKKGGPKTLPAQDTFLLIFQQSKSGHHNASASGQSGSLQRWHPPQLFRIWHQPALATLQCFTLSTLCRSKCWDVLSEQSPASARQQSPQWRFTPGNMQTGVLHGPKSAELFKE